jgi:lipoyl(octanoyl) transferase
MADDRYIAAMPDLSRQLWVIRLGPLGYAEALELQRAVARARITGTIPQDLLLLVEHEPVVTMGRTAKQQNLTASAELLAARGVSLFEVERGGDVTYHGPGQLVGYPVVDLKRHKQDLHWYLRQVEEALIAALAEHGVAGERSTGYTGVWTGGAVAGARHSPRKIASIGVHARDWVTWHGFALNVTTELSYFDLIVPCGIAGVEMTSMSRELGTPVTMRAAENAAVRGFAAVFGLEPVEIPVASLALDAVST